MKECVRIMGTRDIRAVKVVLKTSRQNAKDSYQAFYLVWERFRTSHMKHDVFLVYSFSRAGSIGRAEVCSYGCQLSVHEVLKFLSTLVKVGHEHTGIELCQE